MSKFATADVIKYSAYLVKKEGYIKRSDDEDDCTVNHVIDAITTKSISYEELDSVKDLVKKWFDYINDENQTGEYFDNIRSEIAKSMIDEIKIGLIASSFATFERHTKFEDQNNKEKNSRFLGEEGDVITFNVKDFKLMKVGSSKFHDSTNKWYLYKLHDDEGNVIIYFADCNYDSEFSGADEVSAVVSKLTTFNGVKQTNVKKVQFK